MSSPSTQNLRRSSRLKSKQLEPQQTKSDRNVSGHGEQPNKRRRRNPPLNKDASATPSQGKGGRRRKSLSMLPNMPLDILYEILSLLHPYDLLHLSRTSKAFRLLLMNRSAITIWRRARDNVLGLPNCPSDLSEPAYANLVFDPHCHFCIKARVSTVMWALRVRCCKTCLKDKEAVVTVGEVFRALSPRYSQLKAEPMLPGEFVNDALYCLKSELNKLLELLDACNDDEEALEAVATEQKKAAKKREKSAIDLEAWRLAEIDRRKEEKIVLAQRRRIQILERLSECGYAEELKDVPDALYDRFVDNALVNQPKEITDRIWNNIREPMLVWAEEVRTHHLMQQRCQHYINRLRSMSDQFDDIYDTHPFPQIVPSVADLSWHMSFFREVLEKDRSENVTLEDLLPENFSPYLEGLVMLWRVNMARRLYPLIPPEARPPPGQFKCSCGHHHDGKKQSEGEQSGSGSGSVADGHDSEQRDDDSTNTGYDLATILKASTTWFRCTVDGCLLDFPRILSHECAKRPPPLNLHPETDEDDLRNAYNLALGEVPWNFTGDAINYDMDAHRATQKIIRLTVEVDDKDPWKLEKRMLDELDKRYVCGDCSTDGVLCVMPWRVAVEHLTSEKHRGTDVTLTVLNERDQAWVFEREPEWSQDMIVHSWKMWGCVDCRTSAMTLNDILVHFYEEHDTPLPHVGVDYNLHPDAATLGDAPASVMYYPESMFTTTILR
ncbi:hypothetical protein L226DRAFT_530487 [Lentinus tigrinus ALCF2SS1-7]|uniref:F-box domain-containing protein n=1 Tax=Lentinus tigrinus ALCF2SS1-6 TaxID=1328759 RepID=A0A5C2STC7_9APHY|nr:hypothetical protein L227DRAFT_570272 [Lentinus tigrinus ALCF2SS1-6]RPD80317.1 hypothetical protein L226DRAFT_530487 [Lentinus tigrinus ALCF2SS1-7]